MPAPWKPSLQRTPNSVTPEVPKSWSFSTLQDEDFSAQGEESGTDIVDRFLGGLAPGDPGHEQVDADSLSQTHFLHRSGSFHRDDQEGKEGQAHPRAVASPNTPPMAVFTSQGIDSPPPRVIAEAPGASQVVNEAEEQVHAVEVSIAEEQQRAEGRIHTSSERMGEELTQPYEDAQPTDPPLLCAQLCDDLPCTQPCQDSAAFPATQLYSEEAIAPLVAKPDHSTVTPVRPTRCPRKSDDDSSAKSRMQTGRPSSSQGPTASTLGHTLSPAQQGLRVAVVGDGWGGREGGYEALVTEADHYTFTVIHKQSWIESHVLKENCIFLAEEEASTVGKRQPPLPSKRPRLS